MTLPSTAVPVKGTAVPVLVAVLVKVVPFGCISICGVRESEVLLEDMLNFNTTVPSLVYAPEEIVVEPSDLDWERAEGERGGEGVNIHPLPAPLLSTLFPPAYQAAPVPPATDLWIFK